MKPGEASAIPMSAWDKRYAPPHPALSPQGGRGKTPPTVTNCVLHPADHTVIADWPRQLREGAVVGWPQVAPAGFPWLTAALARACPERVILVVVDGLKTQDLFYQDVCSWLTVAAGIGGDHVPPADGQPVWPRPVLFYPEWEVLPHEARLPHADVISERLTALVELSQPGGPPSRGAPLLVASVAALMQKTLAPARLKSGLRRLEKGEALDPLDLVEWLESQGYEPEAKVTQKGELALRGGILDVFPLTSPWPVRLEFFGNELESLRYFDPATQISREPVERVTLGPAGELGLLKQALLRGGEAPPGTLLDYLPSDAILIACEPARLRQQAGDYGRQIPSGDPFFAGWEEFLAGGQQRGMARLELAEESLPVAGGDHSQNDLGPVVQSLEAFCALDTPAPAAVVAERRQEELFNQIHRWLRQGQAVMVFFNSEGERQRFDEIWRELGLAAPEGAREGLTVCLSPLSRGFSCEAARLVVVTDAEIFGRYKIQRPRRLKSPHAQAVRSVLDLDFAELEPGDFVVHLQYGIGRYAGLQCPAGGDGRECLVIEYAPAREGETAPRLHVPLSEAHLVSKYIGAGRAAPPLNKLSGARWAKTKAQTEAAVMDVAADLLRIQAARASQPGHACGLDTPWQREFESAFIYEETPDQQRAIEAAKRDMEQPKPMDRLVCGDVGFGKTEVAIRAAFKAVMDGRQVAVLAPTTVLAQQHYNTFRERMADYPVKVEVLSRFRSPRQQGQVLRLLAAGGVDIVVGTHRLLQKDVAFKELGLVIVDEEQRFGVRHKERLKQLRHLVDVLTLTATPIPRTLHLALMGVRDLSTIETPPQDRLPVETIVAPFDERLIRDAIQRELNRQGQVYYLHNRIQDLDAVAARLKTLVPSARIVVGHGRMKGDRLEKVMTRFVNGEADVLVSTSIIENGLDIPNANTIIINHAHRFGLSDLYQLRGRVGRYKNQAYAWLLIPRHAALLADARKRISAIRQYSTLGSGFKIALRDLEIRGAGNLLGTEQSGHINAVGFDLYCQLLKQSVARLKGEPVKPRVETQVHLDFILLNAALAPQAPAAKPARQRAPQEPDIQVPREVAVYAEAGGAGPAEAAALDAPPVTPAAAHLPVHYIGEPALRVEAYRKLAQATMAEELEKLQNEWRDRFGPLPEAAELLLLLQEIKILADRRQVTWVETKGDRLMLKRQGDYLLVDGRFPRLEKRTARARLKEIKRFLTAL